MASAALAAAVAVLAIFLIRATGTFWIVRPVATVRATAFIHLIAGLVIVFFLAVFHREYPVRRGSRLAGATSVLIGGCSAGTLLVAVGFLRTLGVVVPGPATTAAVATVVSLLVAFAALMFFTALCSQLDDEDRSRLARAVRLAVAGALLSAVAHAGMFALYATRLMRPELVPLTSPVLGVISILVSGFVVATLVGFLLALRAELRRRPS